MPQDEAEPDEGHGILGLFPVKVAPSKMKACVLQKNKYL